MAGMTGNGGDLVCLIFSSSLLNGVIYFLIPSGLGLSPVIECCLVLQEARSFNSHSPAFP